MSILSRIHLQRNAGLLRSLRVVRRFTSKANTNSTSTNKNPSEADKQKAVEIFRPLAIFGVGLYLGMAFFGTGSKDNPREGSAYLKDLRENFDRTSGVPPRDGSGKTN